MRASSIKPSIKPGARLPPRPPIYHPTLRHLSPQVRVFPHGGGTFQIEPDASSASYFHAVNALFPAVAPVRVMVRFAGLSPNPNLNPNPSPYP